MKFEVSRDWLGTDDVKDRLQALAGPSPFFCVPQKAGWCGLGRQTPFSNFITLAPGVAGNLIQFMKCLLRLGKICRIKTFKAHFSF